MNSALTPKGLLDMCSGTGTGNGGARYTRKGPMYTLSVSGTQGLKGGRGPGSPGLNSENQCHPPISLPSAQQPWKGEQVR